MIKGNKQTKDATYLDLESNKKTFITKILFKLHKFGNFYSESLSIQITALMYDINGIYKFILFT